MRVTQAEFIRILDLYLAGLPEDSCYRQAREYYASRSVAQTFEVDEVGSPVPQLRADARATGYQYLVETEEAVRHVPMLIWRPGWGGADSPYRPDHFAEAARRVVAALKPPPNVLVVVTLDHGVKQGLDGERAVLVEEWRRA